jgi:hypothetical protein
VSIQEPEGCTHAVRCVSISVFVFLGDSNQTAPCNPSRLKICTLLDTVLYLEPPRRLTGHKLEVKARRCRIPTLVLMTASTTGAGTGATGCSMSSSVVATIHDPYAVRFIALEWPFPTVVPANQIEQ